ncbi:hypothetical protein AUC68_14615 [Methyloceanibacter methanicus]|uniref:Uncharacterized protein n=1 Tax=Methyloceanibacter methanicus TaxID=1774968 RepID=A0A1E3W4U7_9HYPH|nr:hypothetical protein [Methyloceanibacter methanicus]ODS00796.1 hypothetical protein AUC68_14615 [Methyloceanibacter methanicus]
MGHITITSAGNRLGGIAAAFACVALLSGCGGVELEGKVFDYAGLSGTVGQKKPDPTMTSRAPLMVPPNLQRLPTPTESRSVAATRADWPDDPEKVRVREIEQQDAVEAETAKANDPLNAYAGKETLLDKVFKGRKKTVAEPVPDVPEPDSSDGVPGSSVASSRQGMTPHQSQAPLPNQNSDAFNPSTPSSYKSGSDTQRTLY